MKEELVTFETAKLASKAGFTETTGGKCWVETLEGKIIHNSERHPRDDDRLGDYYLSQPTQAFLQRWLREKHCIHVNPRLQSFSNNYYIEINIENKHPKFYRDENTSMAWESYEIALEQGLLEALGFIKVEAENTP